METEMRILFTICGRAGSKGIRNKNLREFAGKYLAHYTVSAIDLYLKRHPDSEPKPTKKDILSEVRQHKDFIRIIHKTLSDAG